MTKGVWCCEHVWQMDVAWFGGQESLRHEWELYRGDTSKSSRQGEPDGWGSMVCLRNNESWGLESWEQEEGGQAETGEGGRALQNVMKILILESNGKSIVGFLSEKEWVMWHTQIYFEKIDLATVWGTDWSGARMDLREPLDLMQWSRWKKTELGIS